MKLLIIIRPSAVFLRNKEIFAAFFSKNVYRQTVSYIPLYYTVEKLKMQAIIR
ncbi:MAG: hypothetical protein RR054_05165 [Clostridia bacterium]